MRARLKSASRAALAVFATLAVSIGTALALATPAHAT